MGTKKYLALLGSAALVTSMAALAASPPAQAAVFNLANNTAVVIPASGNAAPFPSTIAQFGMSTVVTDVNVTLLNVSQTWTNDLDIELVSPSGTAVALTSDNCGNNAVAGINLTFDDAAAAPLSTAGPCSGGTYKPSNNNTGADDTWAVAPTGATLAAFNGENPNGPQCSPVCNGGWQLYVNDDFAPGGGSGTLAGGWSLQITTAATAPVNIPAFGAAGSGAANPYPVPIAISGQSGLITDVNVNLNGLTHSWPDDLDMLLVSPSGAKTVLASDACGSGDVINVNWVFDDQAAAGLSDNGPCTSGTFKPSNFEAAVDLFPAPAPASPNTASLAAFNGASPNGTWLLYITDDTNTDGGWLASLPTLTFKTTDVIPPQTTFTKKPKTGFKTTTQIKFSSSEPGSHFECKIDTAKKFTACKSPLKLKHLKYGKHKIQVRAIDAAGNVDPTPLRGKWKIIKKS